MRPLILAAEREAQMVSAFARMAVTTIAVSLFLLSGGAKLPVAPVVLSYLGTYALISIVSVVFSLKRFFNPHLSLLFTAFDGIALALLIGFALLVTGSPLSLHGAVPGFVFIFCILILATMRYTVGPSIVAFASFALTWVLFSNFAEQSSMATAGAGQAALFFFGPVQNTARWGFLLIAALLCLLAVVRRRKTLEAAIIAAEKTTNLSRYLPDKVASLVAEQGVNALAMGRQQQATVLFVDVRGFTGISEKLTPAELGALLSQFRSFIAIEVEAHSGFVEKFIGDAVMAVFGVPEEAPDSEAMGLRCAIDILQRIDGWNETRSANHQNEIHVTIGVHCGLVHAGAIGSEDRMEYTVLGDAVNIAARLQEAAKDTSSGLVVSEDLLHRSVGAADKSGDWSPLETSEIRGRVGKIQLYEFAKARRHTT